MVGRSVLCVFSVRLFVRVCVRLWRRQWKKWHYLQIGVHVKILSSNFSAL